MDDLASYFVEKLSLSADFDPSSSTVPSELLEVSYKKSWRVKPSKVRSMMQTLDVKKTVGSDGVSLYILRYCCDELYYPVCSLFRNVCRAGEFPSSWKVSHITPVHKHKGSTTNP